MEVRVQPLETAIVLVPDGPIDARSWVEFERRVLEAIDQPGKHVVVDFTKVDLVTSAGLRVLVMAGKRLGKTGRKLVLCGVNDLVATVLEVSGLTQAFPMAKTVAEATAALEPTPTAPTAPASGTGVAGHLVRLLALGETPAVLSATGAALAPERLARLGAALVGLLPTPPGDSGHAPSAR